jgi:hypothetical protein
MQSLVDQCVHSGTARAHSVGVANSLGTVGVTQPYGDQFEMRDRAVGGIRQRHWQFDAIQAGLQRSDPHVRSFPLWPAASNHIKVLERGER